MESVQPQSLFTCLDHRWIGGAGCTEALINSCFKSRCFPLGWDSTRGLSRFFSSLSLFPPIYRPPPVSLSNLIFPCQCCPSIRWKISSIHRVSDHFHRSFIPRFDGECHVDRCLFHSLESILSGFNGNSSLSALADGLSDVSFLGDDSFEYRCVFGDPSFGFYRLLPIHSPLPSLFPNSLIFLSFSPLFF